MSQQWVCDVCGQPATMGAKDIVRHEVPGERFVRFSQIGPTKYGCANHPVECVEHRTHLPPSKESK